MKKSVLLLRAQRAQFERCWPKPHPELWKSRHHSDLFKHRSKQLIAFRLLSDIHIHFIFCFEYHSLRVNSIRKCCPEKSISFSDARQVCYKATPRCHNSSACRSVVPLQQPRLGTITYKCGKYENWLFMDCLSNIYFVYTLKQTLHYLQWPHH